MTISARITSAFHQHETTVQTNDSAKTLTIAPKPTGYGSSVNGGELLMLALATCFCNDLYREAAKRGIAVLGVEVEVSGEFGAVGEAGRHFTYQARVTAEASPADIDDLIRHTDRVAEIQNTLRQGVRVSLVT